MIMVISAEWWKLRSFRPVLLTVIGTVVAAVLISLALAKLARQQSAPAAAVDIAHDTVRYLQAGVVLLGILPVAQEYAGRQIGTTLSAVPQRIRLVAAKAAAAAMLLAVTSFLAVGAAVVSAALAGRPVVFGRGLAGLAGPAGSLVLMGLLSLAATLMVRQLLPALVGMLCLIPVLPPVLSGLPGLGRWLPGTGGAVLVAWVAVAGVAGTIRFARSDA